jgi:hypothetical protein
VDLADGIVGDLCQYRAEVEFRIQTVELGAANQGVEGSGPMAAGIGRQLIMPEFWRAKSLSRTRFIPSLSRASWFSVNTSTME